MDVIVSQVSALLIGGMLMLMLLGLASAAVMPGLDRWDRLYFIVLFSLLLLCVGFCVADGFLYGRPGLVVAEIIVWYCETLLVSCSVALFAVYLLHSCGEDFRHSALFRINLVLWGIFFVLLNLAQFTTAFYYVTPDNLFAKGPWYPLGMMPLIAMLFLDLAGLIRRWNTLAGRYRYAFLFYLIPLLIASLVQTAVIDFLIVEIGVTLSTFSMFAIILMNQIVQYTRQQRELAHQRASIMVLQMRPHFIYNTMTSIYYLCDQNPREAKQVTMDFMTYLRKNFTAIVSEEPIPFSEELEHTRAYLAVEQAQFENSLFVDYDIPHTRFSVPPLTLQPLVENAVKHGMDPDSESLHILIQTRATDSGSEIVVENDGFDYNPADDDEPHTALANIRQRLEMMCGGKLIITPREGGGTSVKVIIPDKRKSPVSPSAGKQ